MSADLRTRPRRICSAPKGLCLALPFVLGGCTSLSGLSGGSDYACKAPEGVTCDSVSGTYANAIHNNLPSQRARRPANAGTGDGAAPTRGAAPAVASPASAATMSTPVSLASPLRSSARILRLWFKPWEDADRDLYDQGYVYVQIDAGQWLVDHAQRQIRDAYAPLRPPPKTVKPVAVDGKDATPSQMPQRPLPLQRPSTEFDSLLPPLPAPAESTD